MKNQLVRPEDDDDRIEEKGRKKAVWGIKGKRRVGSIGRLTSKRCLGEKKGEGYQGRRAILCTRLGKERKKKKVSRRKRRKKLLLGRREKREIGSLAAQRRNSREKRRVRQKLKPCHYTSMIKKDKV